MDLYAFKTRLIKYTAGMTLIVISAQVAIYWRTGLHAWPVYTALIASWVIIASISIAHLIGLLTTHLTALLGLLTVIILIAVTPILHPADLLHPTWYLVIVLFSYIFFSRRLSLIIMLAIYGYFLFYAILIMPNTYNLDEIVTLTASLFVTAALCSVASRESGELYKRLATAANTDPMTGLWNRRGMEKIFREVITLSQDNQAPYSVAVFDLDNFKRINDQLGHETGDRVICTAADLISRNIRDDDIAARLGGEEFLLILTKDSEFKIRVVADRIRKNYEADILTAVGGDFRNIATLSAGVVCNIPPTIPALQAIQLADKQLYTAKENGRNKVCEANYIDLIEQNTSYNANPIGKAKFHA